MVKAYLRYRCVGSPLGIVTSTGLRGGSSGGAQSSVNGGCGLALIHAPPKPSTSSSSSIATTGCQTIVVTPALENVAVWNTKQNAIVMRENAFVLFRSNVSCSVHCWFKFVMDRCRIQTKLFLRLHVCWRLLVGVLLLPDIRMAL